MTAEERIEAGELTRWPPELLSVPCRSHALALSVCLRVCAFIMAVLELKQSMASQCCRIRSCQQGALQGSPATRSPPPPAP